MDGQCYAIVGRSTENTTPAQKIFAVEAVEKQGKSYRRRKYGANERKGRKGEGGDCEQSANPAGVPNG
jgi:hypothetical protein